MLSSRATIAAGTRPPRVMATQASKGPSAVRRQASARLSRWNWSQLTGKLLVRGSFTLASWHSIGIGGWQAGLLMFGGHHVIDRLRGGAQAEFVGRTQHELGHHRTVAHARIAAHLHIR